MYSGSIYVVINTIKLLNSSILIEKAKDSTRVIKPSPSVGSSTSVHPTLVSLTCCYKHSIFCIDQWEELHLVTSARQNER